EHQQLRRLAPPGGGHQFVPTPDRAQIVQIALIAENLAVEPAEFRHADGVKMRCDLTRQGRLAGGFGPMQAHGSQAAASAGWARYSRSHSNRPTQDRTR